MQFRLQDPEPLLLHGEVIWRDDVRVGYVRAGAFGYTLGAAVGLGSVAANEPVTRAYLDAGSWEIEVAGQRYAATPSLRPMYDPRGERIRA